MHTSTGAACGRDDDAPELRVCRSFRTLKVKEIAWHVNLRFLGGRTTPEFRVEFDKVWWGFLSFSDSV
jgi:hypothetical protein